MKTLQEDYKLKKLIESKKGINLDIGCGPVKQENWIGLDNRELPGVDIIHDIENIPWPLPDNCVFQSIMSHVYEHINPIGGKVLEVMDEIWRITKPGGKLAIAMPYGVNALYQQDPTHCNPANHVTWQYFDPRYPLWNIYQPKPWQIERGFPVWQVAGTMEVMLIKMIIETPGDNGKEISSQSD